MSSIEEWYDRSTDEVVPVERSAEFQRTIAWPAMNSLCRIDFPNEARYGDSFTVEKTVGDNFFRLELGFIELDDYEEFDESDYEDGAYLYANLEVSRRRNDLKSQLTRFYKLDRLSRAAKNEGESKPEADEVSLGRIETMVEGESDEEQAYGAWEVRRYHFSPVEEHGVGVTIAYDLSCDGGTVWSTENPVDWSDETSDEDEEIENIFSDSLTQKDIALIRKGFAVLGVHPVFLEWSVRE